MKTSEVVVLAALCGLLGACETTESQLADGSSVRALIEAQTADPAAASRNSTAIPQGTDAGRAVGAVEAMRGGVAKPTEGWSSTIDIGSTSTNDTE